MSELPTEVQAVERRERRESFECAWRSWPSEGHPGSNEDSVLIEPDTGLFGVFDGIGGHAAGREASATAADAVRDAVLRWDDVDDAEAGSDMRTQLADVLREAHRAVVERGNELYLALKDQDERDHWRPPGTTATVVKVHSFNDGRRMAYIAHCGDSRVYVLRKDGRLEQLTTDHDMLSNPDVIHKLEERFHREFPQTAIDKYRELLDSVSGETEMPDALGRYLFHSRNIVHSSLGSGSGIRIDTNVTEISEGDTLILCSDGLSGNLTRQRIQDISATAGSPEELVERAAHEAYEYAHLEPPSYTKGQPRVRNHRDDITVIVAKGK